MYISVTRRVDRVAKVEVIAPIGANCRKQFDFALKQVVFVDSRIDLRLFNLDIVFGSIAQALFQRPG